MLTPLLEYQVLIVLCCTRLRERAKLPVVPHRWGGPTSRGPAGGLLRVIKAAHFVQKLREFHTRQSARAVLLHHGHPLVRRGDQAPGHPVPRRRQQIGEIEVPGDRPRLRRVPGHQPRAGAVLTLKVLCRRHAGEAMLPRRRLRPVVVPRLFGGHRHMTRAVGAAGAAAAAAFMSRTLGYVHGVLPERRPVNLLPPGLCIGRAVGVRGERGGVRVS
mmetsp:Transcript_151975/g.487869  ORF Transcript_151975/g.487869 Transcript_151975/m.487869 type:complete len:216 (+) Transcript_151975:3070-3717(+)